MPFQYYINCFYIFKLRKGKVKDINLKCAFNWTKEFQFAFPEFATRERNVNFPKHKLFETSYREFEVPFHLTFLSAFPKIHM